MGLGRTVPKEDGVWRQLLEVATGTGKNQVISCFLLAVCDIRWFCSLISHFHVYLWDEFQYFPISLFLSNTANPGTFHDGSGIISSLTAHRTPGLPFTFTPSLGSVSFSRDMLPLCRFLKFFRGTTTTLAFTTQCSLPPPGRWASQLLRRARLAASKRGPRGAGLLEAETTGSIKFSFFP